MRIKVLIASVIVLALIAGAAIFILEPGAIAVETEQAEVRDVIRNISASGYVVADIERKIPALHNMRIIDLGVDAGDHVQRDAVLARGDTSDLEVERRDLQVEIAAMQTRIRSARQNLPGQIASAQGQIDSAAIEREHAEDSLETAKELYEAGAIPRTQLEAAESRAAQTRAALQAAESSLREITAERDTLDRKEEQISAMRDRIERINARIDEHTVRAPDDLVVAERLVDEGDLVAAGTPLFLLQSEAVHVEAEILAQDARSVALDQRVILSGDALDNEFEARVRRIHPRAVERVSDLGVTQRRVPIDIRLEEIPPGVSAGYPVDIDIIVDEKRALAVSRDAVFTLAGDHHVFRVVEGRARLTAIEVGLEGDDDYEILSGLSEGDHVVINPPRELEDGSRTR